MFLVNSREMREATLLPCWCGSPQPGDTFTFSVDTTTEVLEMPVYVVLDEQAPVNPEIRSILNDYVKAVFRRAGMERIVFVDERFYHNLSGSVHCGSNVERRIPAYNWWQQEAGP